MYKRSFTRGFTIVELLIVIVVIAILAAISIVAYNGIQSRARNSAIESTVSSYLKLLKVYTATYGAYPTTSGTCLCSVSDYDTAAMGVGKCFPNPVSALSTLESELKKVGTLPPPNVSCFTMYGTCRNAISFYRNGAFRIDGVTHNNYLIYFLENNGNCTLPGNLGPPWTNFSRTNTPGYVERNSGTSMCVIEMPDTV